MGRRIHSISLFLGLISFFILHPQVSHADVSPNLMQDPGFENGKSGCSTSNSKNNVTRSTLSPISGRASLKTVTKAAGPAVACSVNVSTTYALASQLSVTLVNRPNTTSSGTLSLCANAVYTGGTSIKNCATLNKSAGQVSTNTMTLALDSTMNLSTVQILLFQNSSVGTNYSFDNASMQVTYAPEPTPMPPPPASGHWVPDLNTSWQWQLSYPLDTSIDIIPGVVAYDIDLFDNSAATVADLHSRGLKTICYVSFGSWENWRPDASQFPSTVLGRNLSGWAGEKWLDIRDGTVRSLMTARLDQCKAKGFDAVEPDNIDGYMNNPGFPLTYNDQLDYNRFIAAEAHARGLGVALKNDLDQVQDLVADFDFAVNEECFAYNECNLLTPFISAGKAVFQVEYEQMSTSSFCPQANAMNFNSMLKNLDLDFYREACRP